MPYVNYGHRTKYACKCTYASGISKGLERSLQMRRAAFSIIHAEAVKMLIITKSLYTIKIKFVWLSAVSSLNKIEWTSPHFKSIRTIYNLRYQHMPDTFVSANKHNHRKSAKSEEYLIHNISKRIKKHRIWLSTHVYTTRTPIILEIRKLHKLVFFNMRINICS